VRDPQTNQAIDCFDLTSEAEHVRAANEWVRQFSEYFKARSSILVTVGMSTEMKDEDQRPGEYNFFKTSLGGYSFSPLSAYVDFISPHNYHGEARERGEYIRDNAGEPGRRAIIVLEEYGWPSDMLGQGGRQDLKEGCWDPDPARSNDPMLPQEGRPCPADQHDPGFQRPDRAASGSAFVELNTSAIRGRGHADYAGGVAFMVADIDARTTESPPDDFTGLFATYVYLTPCCGDEGAIYGSGTWAKNGQPEDQPPTPPLSPTVKIKPKATAFRIRTHHCYWPEYSC
jgi:hypothetical protein